MEFINVKETRFVKDKKTYYEVKQYESDEGECVKTEGSPQQYIDYIVSQNIVNESEC